MKSGRMPADRASNQRLFAHHLEEFLKMRSAETFDRLQRYLLRAFYRFVRSKAAFSRFFFGSQGSAAGQEFEDGFDAVQETLAVIFGKKGAGGTGRGQSAVLLAWLAGSSPEKIENYLKAIFRTICIERVTEATGTGFKNLLAAIRKELKTLVADGNLEKAGSFFIARSTHKGEPVPGRSCHETVLPRLTLSYVPNRQPRYSGLRESLLAIIDAPEHLGMKWSTTVLGSILSKHAGIGTFLAPLPESGETGASPREIPNPEPDDPIAVLSKEGRLEMDAGSLATWTHASLAELRSGSPKQAQILREAAQVGLLFFAWKRPEEMKTHGLDPRVIDRASTFRQFYEEASLFLNLGKREAFQEGAAQKAAKSLAWNRFNQTFIPFLERRLADAEKQEIERHTALHALLASLAREYPLTAGSPGEQSRNRI